MVVFCVHVYSWFVGVTSSHSVFLGVLVQPVSFQTAVNICTINWHAIEVKLPSQTDLVCLFVTHICVPRMTLAASG